MSDDNFCSTFEVIESVINSEKRAFYWAIEKRDGSLVITSSGIYKKSEARSFIDTLRRYVDEMLDN